MTENKNPPECKTNIVNIKPVAVTQTAPTKPKKEKRKTNPKLIALAKDILKQAEQGTLTEISYVTSSVNKKDISYGTVGKSDNCSRSYLLLQELLDEYYHEVIVDELGLE